MSATTPSAMTPVLRTTDSGPVAAALLGRPVPPAAPGARTGPLDFLRALDCPWRVAVLAFAVATLAALAIHAAVPGLAKFPTYYPAVLIAALGGGVGAGAAVLVGGGIAATFFFLEPHWSFALPPRDDLLSLGLYALLSSMLVSVGARLRDALRRQALIIRELNHRTRNALAVVQSVVRLSSKADAESYGRAVAARVGALARAHTYLADGAWAGTDLAAVIWGEVSLVMVMAEGDRRTRLRGPAVALPAVVVQSMVVVLHEMAANAAQHGAVAAPGGSLTVVWTLDRAAGRVRLRWTERGGPAVTGPPARLGFGLRVIDATVKAQLRGAVVRRWERDGLVCEMDLRMPWEARG